MRATHLLLGLAATSAFTTAQAAYNCEIGSGGTDLHLRIQRYTVAQDDSLVFRGSTAGYATYRIPALVRTPAGDLLAFAEGRHDGSHDWGDIDVVCRRSTDDGLNWGPLQVVLDDGPNTCGNPTPIIDWETGSIWIFMSWNPSTHNQFGSDGLEQVDEWGERRVLSMVSHDDGATWTSLVDWTALLLPDDRCWDAIGPGIGIQIRHGAFAGRLMAPALARNLYSDDHGVTWQYQLIPVGTSEGTLVELCNGDLMRNDRGACEDTCPPSPGSCEWRDRKRRQISTSSDDGLTWSSWVSDEELLDKPIQASILRYNENYPHRILFVNAASTVCRCKMRVRISYDDGESWPIQRCLDPIGCGPSSWRGGYSSITKTSDLQVGVLHEVGDEPGYGNSIVFRKFNLPWIINGTPEPVPTVDVPGIDASPVHPVLVAEPVPSKYGVTLSFELHNAGPASLRIVDAAGRIVRELASRTFTAGRHTVRWDGRGTTNRRVADGVYFAILDAVQESTSRKLVITSP